MENPLNYLVREQLDATIGVIRAVAADEQLHAVLVEAASATANAIHAGRKLMTAGNGGSAADAQHVAAEFVSRLCKDRPALRAIALTTDTSILTAVGNDYGFERLFARQIEALGQPGDIFLAISTSGNSSNILRALELCAERGITTIGFSGSQGGKMKPLCDYNIVVPSGITMNIQEAHLALEHTFCLLVEKIYFHSQRSGNTQDAALITGRP